MKIKILGSSGFVGSHLLKSLNNSEGISIRGKNWKDKIHASDVIINLIGKAHDHKGVFTKEDYYEANFELVKYIFQQFIRSEAKLFIHISSIAAIEEIESDIPLDEEYIPSPISFYGSSKLAAEQWLLSQDLPVNKKIIILRPPMIHGSFDKGNLRLLYNFVKKGLPYPLSKYENRRTFLYIENFIFYLNEIINKNILLSSGVYHISDNESLSMEQILKIIEYTDKFNILRIPLPKFLLNGLAKMGDSLNFPINTKRLKKLTSNLLVSNLKINKALSINSLPFSAVEGMNRTILSLYNKEKS